MPESVILDEGLGGGFFGQGIANALMGNSTTDEEDKSLERVAQIRDEFIKIEAKMGIDAEEIKSFYETMTVEDAKDVVAKTIEKIPLGLMKGVLWKVDNINRFGGQVMLWAAVRTPMEAPIVAASVMILTMGGWQEAVATDDIARQETLVEDGNPLDLETAGYALTTDVAITPEEEKAEEKVVALNKGPVHSSHVHVGLFN